VNADGPIGLLGAMEPEVRGLVDAMTVGSSGRGAGFDYWQGTLAGQACVVARCGMGKVSAAAGVQRLIDQFSISRLIVCGLAGGLQPDLDIGDVVIGQRFVQYDLDASPIYPRFEAPGLGLGVFQADAALVEQAATAAARIEQAPNVRRGLIVTGDQFVKDGKRHELLRDFPDALCVEMEGGAIAQVCHLNELPFVIVRVISDRADGTAPADFQRFVSEVAPAYTVGIVTELLRRLS
jgi:adenosylhomocysteine nucleosidase